MRHDDDAIVMFLDGTLPGEDEQAFRAQLLQDPDLLARLLDIAENEVLVRSVLLQRAEAAGAAELPEARRRRHEYAELRARLRTRRAILTIALSAAAAAVLAAVVVWFGAYREGLDRREGARVVALRGTATILDADGGSRRAEVGMRVEPGSSVQTAQDGRCAIDCGDGAEVHVSPDTRLEIVAGGTDRNLALASGVVRADVLLDASRAPMRISTQFADAVVNDTVFQLEVAEGGTRLQVARGLVEFARDEQMLLVVEDECALAARDRELSVFTADAPFELEKGWLWPPRGTRKRRAGGRDPSWRRVERKGPGSIRIAGTVEAVDPRAAKISVRMPNGVVSRYRLPPEVIVRVRGSLMGEVLPGDRVMLRRGRAGDPSAIREVMIVRPPGSRRSDRIGSPVEKRRRDATWRGDEDR
jgi:ferric-dicitrate binding protein FerR (iron transport regulator)